MKIVVVSGGFDPPHKGHLKLFEEATKMGDKLICLLNTNAFIVRKRSNAGKVGKPFYQCSETRWDLIYTILLGISVQLRSGIVSHLRTVEVRFVIDDDDTVCRTLEILRYEYPDADIIFANGGDRDSEKAIPEADVCKENNIRMVFGVGGIEKRGRSSELIRQ